MACEQACPCPESACNCDPKTNPDAKILKCGMDDKTYNKVRRRVLNWLKIYIKNSFPFPVRDGVPQRGAPVREGGALSVLGR